MCRALHGAAVQFTEGIGMQCSCGAAMVERLHLSLPYKECPACGRVFIPPELAERIASERRHQLFAGLPESSGKIVDR